MTHNESESPPEKHERAPERKLSTSEEPRVRTRSFNAHGTLHLTREYVGDEMDKQLHTRNLVKKAIPKDNAIFRAVCEQISSVQTDHSDLRILVENILSPIAKQHFKDSNSATFERDIEILKILANITSSRIIVYRSHTDDPEVYEGEEMIENREIQVCETQYRSVYEPVYSEEIHEALAISQSIVYRTLYEGVFDYPKTMVDKMINYIREDNDKHAKSTIDQVYSQCDHRVRTESFSSPLHSANAVCSARPPQVPFCVCKSLDPSIYRNVEYTLYKKKTENEVRAAQNSMEVKFGHGARCQARDGPRTRYAVVEQVVKPDVRLVRFEDNNSTREFNVADLRPVPQPHSFHDTVPSLLNGIRGGPPPQMTYLPGCMPPPPPPPMSMQQQFYGSPPPPMGPPFAPIYAMPPLMGMHMTVPPPSSPFFSPPPMYEHQSMFQFPDQMMMGGGGPPPPPPPPTPMDRDRSMGYSPPADSPLDTSSSVFPSTPLSTRSGDEGRRARDKKPRALSAELTDSPTTGRPNKKTTESKKTKGGLTWFTMPPKDEKEKRKGGRRATEGDTVGEMNRPLQPKQHRLSTCGSQENDASALPSLMDPPVQQMQQLQLQQGGGAARANLPSLLPLPSAQARPSYYASSEWTGSDQVFKDGEGNVSQLSLVMNHEGPLLSSSSMEAQPPSMGFQMMEVPVGGCSQISAPNFTMQEFLDEVGKEATYSEKHDGSDLPNTPTTRFFYNLGLQFYNDNLKDSIMAPPADSLPMPPTFSVTSPTMPPQSPAFPPDSMSFAVFHPSAAPPNTPAVSMAPPLMAPHLFQYMHPGVEGMPIYAWGVSDDRGGGGVGPMMAQGPMGMVPSPSPLMSDGTGQHFFFN